MQNPYSQRRIVITGIVIIIAIVFIVKLFLLQVIDTSYKFSADNNSRQDFQQYPARGLIYDRNGELLVYNEAAYDIMVHPGQLKAFDTIALCELLDIDTSQVVSGIRSAIEYSKYKPSIFLRQVSSETYALFQESLYKYPGFFVQPRTLRKYPKDIAAHILGYIGEVDEKTVDTDEYYDLGDYIGISGVERSYEEVLRGEKGVKYFLVDVHNRIKGAYMNGRYDKEAIVGKNIYITLDCELQTYGEKLMQNKIGSIVCIEPRTGEILSMVSSPTYSPSLLVGRVRNRNYEFLRQDTLKPEFNRSLMAKYPPGSIFKMVQALIALQEKVISPYSGFSCDKSLVSCHGHPYPTNVQKGIMYSCNPYFYKVFQRLILRGKDRSHFIDSRYGLAVWREQVMNFGLGKTLGVDLPGEKGGFIPDTSFYDRWYGGKRWAFSTVYSNGIGQGEVEVVPLQMANLAAIFANKGSYFTPHIIKKIEGEDTIPTRFLQRHFVPIDSNYFDIAERAMLAVVEDPFGTASLAKIENIHLCGKTGTAENPGEDHSVFIAYAPMEDPQIAIAVYVENAGFGGTWAAPLASLMVEKYLNDSISDIYKENRILNANFINP